MSIKDRSIPKEEFMRLLFTKIDRVNTHELSMWLKSQTNNQWVVVPKAFCDLAIKLIDFLNDKNFLAGEKEVLDNIYSVKKYL
jgi:hypothetical protein